MFYLIPLLILCLPLATADDLVGCYSSIDGTKYGDDQYQTPSLCSNNCPDSPYVALINGDTCYCLDSKPASADETSSSKCSTSCFGYGQLMCGGSSSYSVYVGKGTSSDDDDSLSSSTDDTTTSSPPSSSAAADQKSSTEDSTTASSSSTTTTSSSSSSSTSTTSSSSTDSSSITDAPSSSDDQRVITTSSSNSHGSYIIKTVTKDSTPSATSTSSSKDGDDDKNQKKSSGGTNTGAIVGGVVGGVAGVVILALLAFFFIRRKRQDEEDDDEEEYFDKPVAGSLSRGYGASKSKKSGKSNVLDMPMTNPFTHPSDNNNGANELVDPRLNPVMLGRRRLSEGSLADETDYSRKILQVANPDSS